MRKPSAEEYHSHLFMALVRTRQYKQQQQVLAEHPFFLSPPLFSVPFALALSSTHGQTASAMYRTFKNPPYYLWWVMSILAQVLVLAFLTAGPG